MKIIIFILLLIFSAVSVTAQTQMYFIELSNVDGSYAGDVFVNDGFVSNIPGDYEYTLFSVDGAILDTMTFGLEQQIGYVTDFFGAEETTTGIETLEVSKHLLTAPHFPTGNLIRLNKPDGSTLTEIDVSQFRNVCGDNFCSGGESFESCSVDCPEVVATVVGSQILGTAQPKQSIIDVVGKSQVSFSDLRKKTYFDFIEVFVLVAVVFGVFAYLRNRKEKKEQIQGL